MLHALIIEDELVIALGIESLLAEMGYASADIAVSPLEAAHFASRRCPDLVTADYRIEDGTGVQAVELVFRQCGRRPVVYITGDPAQVARLGEPVVEKPVLPGLLKQALIDAGAPVELRQARGARARPTTRDRRPAPK